MEEVFIFSVGRISTKNKEFSPFLLVQRESCFVPVALAIHSRGRGLLLSYCGVKRVRGKRGRGAVGKTPIFRILKREGKISVAIVKKCNKEELLPIIQEKILEGSTIPYRWMESI
ncbi:transposase [Candidatus Peregrinibacteria bacterium]|nr:MAG: transposase [Candidatus Peregrinibacteria bacterium]